jgi:enoyl-CoA hydratase/carnithine racemase
MSEPVIARADGNVLWVRLNRADALNAIDAGVVRGLARAWRRLEEDPDLRVGVVIGAGGRAFSVGADLKAPPAPAELASILPRIGVEITKPLIAAVTGHCLGGGLVLALGCDLRIATHSARFGYPEPRIGTTGGNASALTRHLPRAIAMEMLFTGEPLSPERAHETGFVNRLVEDDALEDAAADLAGRIAANAPLVVQAMKRLVMMGETPTPVETAGAAERILSTVRGSPDEAEGRAAFREKRAPRFTGRPRGEDN